MELSLLRLVSEKELTLNDKKLLVLSGATSTFVSFLHSTDHEHQLIAMKALLEVVELAPASNILANPYHLSKLLSNFYFPKNESEILDECRVVSVKLLTQFMVTAHHASEVADLETTQEAVIHLLNELDFDDIELAVEVFKFLLNATVNPELQTILDEVLTLNTLNEWTRAYKDSPWFHRPLVGILANMTGTYDRRAWFLRGRRHSEIMKDEEEDEMEKQMEKEMDEELDMVLGSGSGRNCLGGNLPVLWPDNDEADMVVEFSDELLSLQAKKKEMLGYVTLFRALDSDDLITVQHALRGLANISMDENQQTRMLRIRAYPILDKVHEFMQSDNYECVRQACRILSNFAGNRNTLNTLVPQSDAGVNFFEELNKLVLRLEETNDRSSDKARQGASEVLSKLVKNMMDHDPEHYDMMMAQQAELDEETGKPRNAQIDLVEKARMRRSSVSGLEPISSTVVDMPLEEDDEKLSALTSFRSSRRGRSSSVRTRPNPKLKISGTVVPLVKEGLITSDIDFVVITDQGEINGKSVRKEIQEEQERFIEEYERELQEYAKSKNASAIINRRKSKWARRTSSASGFFSLEGSPAVSRSGSSAFAASPAKKGKGAQGGTTTTTTVSTAKNGDGQTEQMETEPNQQQKRGPQNLQVSVGLGIKDKEGSSASLNSTGTGSSMEEDDRRHLIEKTANQTNSREVPAQLSVVNEDAETSSDEDNDDEEEAKTAAAARRTMGSDGKPANSPKRTIIRRKVNSTTGVGEKKRGGLNNRE
eukprot:TRINITY_DN938_c0_g1_i1.p1 TRINITY_DN938_c0_g1~~TRINITY_DN938_c0_g1_i1.p1  ORF type:complete len:765 (-),score=261.01 TRINITY_DN938_c0_g1_i1:2-2296(-)